MPSTPEEVLVAGVFAELLEVPSVGVEQDFLELGGNSLLAAQLIDGIRKRSGTRLRIRQVLGTPTVPAPRRAARARPACRWGTARPRTGRTAVEATRP